MQLRISNLKLRGIVVLVIDKLKGITLVFKNDPLEKVDVSSSFDNVPNIRRFLQAQIEGQLRKMFQDDLPQLIHNLSLLMIEEKTKQNQYLHSAAAAAGHHGEIDSNISSDNNYYPHHQHHHHHHPPPLHSHQPSRVYSRSECGEHCLTQTDLPSEEYVNLEHEYSHYYPSNHSQQYPHRHVNHCYNSGSNTNISTAPSTSHVAEDVSLYSSTTPRQSNHANSCTITPPPHPPPTSAPFDYENQDQDQQPVLLEKSLSPDFDRNERLGGFGLGRLSSHFNDNNTAATAKVSSSSSLSSSSLTSLNGSGLKIVNRSGLFSPKSQQYSTKYFDNTDNIRSSPLYAPSSSNTLYTSSNPAIFPGNYYYDDDDGRSTISANSSASNLQAATSANGRHYSSMKDLSYHAINNNMDDNDINTNSLHSSHRSNSAPHLHHPHLHPHSLNQYNGQQQHHPLLPRPIQTSYSHRYYSSSSPHLNSPGVIGGAISSPHTAYLSAMTAPSPSTLLYHSPQYAHSPPTASNLVMSASFHDDLDEYGKDGEEDNDDDRMMPGDRGMKFFHFNPSHNQVAAHLTSLFNSNHTISLHTPDITHFTFRSSPAVSTSAAAVQRRKKVGARNITRSRLALDKVFTSE